MPCKKCILPEQFQEIQFDEKHVCNYCNKYRSMCRYKGEDKLKEEIQKYRNPESKYDCVIPVSGGKDSIYALYYAKKILNLNPIAVNYDSGFQVDMATQNIKNACEALQVPIVWEKDKFSKKLIRLNLKIGAVGGEDNSLGRGEGNLNFCNNCEALLRSVAIHVAKKNKVGLIFWGSHSIEDEMANPLMDIFYRRIGNRTKMSFSASFHKIQKRIKDKFYKEEGKLFVRVFEWNLPIRYFYLGIHYQMISVIQKLHMHVPLRAVFASRGKVAFTKVSPKFVLLFDYVDFFYYFSGGKNVKDNMKVLKDNLKWQCPEGKESRFDCEIHNFSNYFFMQKNGITMDGAKLCNHIREGHMTREEVEKREKILLSHLVEDCKSMIKRIGVKNITIRGLQEKGSLAKNKCIERKSR